jgi:hypothetical protein
MNMEVELLLSNFGPIDLNAIFSTITILLRKEIYIYTLLRYHGLDTMDSMCQEEKVISC